MRTETQIDGSHVLRLHGGRKITYFFMVDPSSEFFDKRSGCLPVTIVKNGHHPRPKPLLGVCHCFSLVIDGIGIRESIPKSCRHLPSSYRIRLYRQAGDYPFGIDRIDQPIQWLQRHVGNTVAIVIKMMPITIDLDYVVMFRL